MHDNATPVGSKTPAMNAEPQTQWIDRRQLRDHPDNANIMPDEAMEKLTRHVASTGQYPPLIVRPMPGEAGAYQILDGHHRNRALGQLNHEQALCVIWQVDDAGALMFLVTLNRLQGQDDPKLRAQLLAKLEQDASMDLRELSKLLPESRKQLDKLFALNAPPPPPREEVALETMPQSVHFFLLPADKRKLDATLREIGGPREQALMAMVTRHTSHATQGD